MRDARWKLISNPLPGETNLSAKAYIEGFNAHFAGGTRAAEIEAAPDRVRAAYARFFKPPRYELYDLEADPYEWENLADDPAHAETKVQMIAALQRWQRETRDPFGDEASLRDFVASQREMADLSYRKQKGFRWPYLDRFPKAMK